MAAVCINNLSSSPLHNKWLSYAISIFYSFLLVPLDVSKEQGNLFSQMPRKILFAYRTIF